MLLYKIAQVVFLVFIQTGFAHAGSVEKFNPPELHKLFDGLTVFGGKAVRTLSLGKSLVIPVLLEGTTKGNGSIFMHNISVRLFDQHDDGMVYENTLTVDIQDITGDGLKELLISGMLKFTGEKENDPVEYKPVVIVYTFDCESGYFKKIYGLNADYAELLPQRVKSIRCGEW